jgi:hypothetical protein
MLTTAAALTDRELLARLQLLAKHDRAITVELIAHLAELARRPILVAEAHSMFSFCHEVLGFSEDATYNRIEVAKAVRKFPVLLDRMADGSLTLSTARVLAPHLTAANHLAVLAEAAGKSKRAVEVLVARLSPRPDVPSVIRKLPTPAPSTPPAPSAPAAMPVDSPRGESGSVAAPPSPTASTSLPAAPPASPQRPARSTLVALSQYRYGLTVTVGQETHDDLRRLQDFLCREVPDGDLARIVEMAVALLRKETETKKRAATDAPRRSTGTAPGSRDVAADVQRKVWDRDQGRCAFVGKSGRRCAARRFLEIHHLDPHALGGGKTPDELSLRCSRHNRYESELYFGPYVPAAGPRASQPSA